VKELVGEVLAGRYRIDSLIGRGGMADVFAGTDTMLERPVAIKVLTDRSDAVLRRFLREAQSMAALNHRNIVAVYDAGQSTGVSFIIMELIAGRTLGTIPAAELTMHVAIRYFIDLLEALAYAHEQSVIHRDIKPANIMVTDDGTVKVMDFGLSRRTTEMSSETNAGEIVGTIAYLAPERFLGKIADARSDLYSVGVVMYEIFTGRVPFLNAADDLVAVIFAHVNDVPASLRSINRAVPPQVDRIVLKLLEKDADLRYATARELTADLQALIGGPVAAASPSPTAASAAVAAPSGPDAPHPTMLGLGTPTPLGPPSFSAGRRPPAAPPFDPRAATGGRKPVVTGSTPVGGIPKPDTADARAARTQPGVINDAVRSALNRTFGNSTALNAGYANTLAGMLAARKRDYPEAIRTYTLALDAFTETRNELEHAKTAVKYAAMILQKNSETERPERREVDDATKLLGTALPGIRGSRMLKELEEGERVFYALQRIGLRLR
jgi:serine/threonine protein kinase